MDLIEMKKVTDELLKEFERTEGYNILVYSSDKTRDFGLLSKKMEKYRKRIGKALLAVQVEDERDKTVSLS